MAKKISLQEVARFPRPGTSGPRRYKFTPDGKRLAYLANEEGSLILQLWEYNLETGARQQVILNQEAGTSGRPLSREEELRRERSRLREIGVTSYQYAPQAAYPVLLVPQGGNLFIRKGEEPFHKLPEVAEAVEPKLSPDGSMVAFVRDNELQVVPTSGGPPLTLTKGAGNGITNGLAEYIAQEEMGRAEGFWWSPDGRFLAYEQADSSPIPVYPIVHQGTAEPEIEEHRYPFAGKANASVRLGVVPVEGGETRWMNLGQEDDFYLARVDWRPDGVLAAQLESRDQRSLRLVTFGPDGKAALLLEEKAEPWINLGSDLRFLKSGEFLWSSEKSGFRHLYLHDQTGRELKALTAGDWIVTEVVALDEDRRMVLFRGTRESVLERHLYCVSLDGGEITRLTAETGWHETEVSPDFTRFVDKWSSTAHAPKTALRRIDGSLEKVLYEDRAANAAALDLPLPELASFKTGDGTELQAAIYNPASLEPGRKAPIIVSVYGGPHAQRVTNQWDLTVDLRAQYLAQEGFVVLKVDNRGSANRGLKFEAALAGNMGDVEVKDQVEGVRFLAARPYADAERVGITGWSYGGFMTLMALLRAPEVFKVGVAGAPVTHWDGYDTHYTERYMGSFEKAREAYDRSSVMPHVENLKGKLLLVHGMVDENVHFRHTARLIVALTKAQKFYDLLIFPEERHMPRDANGLEYMERRLADYFITNL